MEYPLLLVLYIPPSPIAHLTEKRFKDTKTTQNMAAHAGSGMTGFQNLIMVAAAVSSISFHPLNIIIFLYINVYYQSR
jgi:hypothetical protein